MERFLVPKTCSVVIGDPDRFSPVAYESLMGIKKIPKKISPVRVSKRTFVYDRTRGFFV